KDGSLARLFAYGRLIGNQRHVVTLGALTPIPLHLAPHIARVITAGRGGASGTIDCAFLILKLCGHGYTPVHIVGHRRLTISKRALEGTLPNGATLYVCAPSRKTCPLFRDMRLARELQTLGLGLEARTKNRRVERIFETVPHKDSEI